MRLASYSQTNLALGSDVTLTLVSDKSVAEVDKIFGVLWHYIYVFERSFSRFIPGSELSLFNRSAGLRVEISPEFRELLVAAKDISEATGSLYNPFILPALQRAGYKKSAVPGYEQDPVDDYSKRRVSSIDQLQIGDTWASIPSDTAIDMGGCGKGYLADKLGAIASSLGIASYRFELGGDIATAGTDEFKHKWLIGIQDANNLSGEITRMIECPTRPHAVATSGTFRRRGHVSAKDWHHIIDPLTLQPAVTDIRLVTVGTDSALQADVLASCVVIVGSDKSIDFLRSHNVKQVLVQNEGQGGAFEKHLGRFIMKESISRGRL